jgi:signal transduction histidine kinase
LAQVVSNLVSNAIDATDQDGTIVVTIARGDDHQGIIRVSDDGCGIDPKNLGRVFEPFFTTKKDVGTGLGLWVSREIVEKLGGKIAVTSDGERRGATFSITLPLYEGGNTRAASAAQSDGEPGDAG